MGCFGSKKPAQTTQGGGKAKPTTDQDVMKIVVTGNTGVGKTALLTRLTKDTFSENIDLGTQTVDTAEWFCTVGKKKIKVDLWDTAGQERFRTLTSSYYNHSDLVVIVIDPTNQQDFKEAGHWHTEALKYVENEQVILCVNKIDLQGARTVSGSDIREFARMHAMPVFEVSCKSGEGVEEMFQTIIERELESNT